MLLALFNPNALLLLKFLQITMLIICTNLQKTTNFCNDSTVCLNIKEIRCFLQITFTIVKIYLAFLYVLQGNFSKISESTKQM